MKKKLISLCLAVLLCSCLTIPVFAEADPLVYDDADILTEREEETLNTRLADISSEYKAEVIIITLPSANGRDVGDYAERIYEENGFGYGDDNSGILLLVSMDNPREFDIVSIGEASKALKNDELENVLDAMESYMRDDDYAAAFEAYADKCEYYLDGYINGFPFDVGGTLIFALVVGIVIGLISVLVMKSKLKSVRRQNQANVYVRPGSMQVNIHNDLYLYSTVSRIRKQTNNSSGSGGGGGVSRSSGGRSF